jgi:hypothetical protein
LQVSPDIHTYQFFSDDGKNISFEGFLVVQYIDVEE